jgi:hypothetical protein
MSVTLTKHTLSSIVVPDIRWSAVRTFLQFTSLYYTLQQVTTRRAYYLSCGSMMPTVHVKTKKHYVYIHTMRFIVELIPGVMHYCNV